MAEQKVSSAQTVANQAGFDEAAEAALASAEEQALVNSLESAGVDVTLDIPNLPTTRANPEVEAFERLLPPEEALPPEPAQPTLEPAPEPTPASTRPASGAADEAASHLDEIRRLTSKLGEQGARIGPLEERIAALQAEVDQARAASQPQQTGRDLLLQLEPDLDLDNMDPDTRAGTVRLGNMLLRLTQMIGAHYGPEMQKISARQDAFEAGARERDALSDIPGKVQNAILERLPGIADIGDPDRRADVMKALAAAMNGGRASLPSMSSTPGEPPAAGNPGSLLNPAMHVSGGRAAGGSRPGVDRATLARQKVEEMIDGAESNKDLSVVESLLTAQWRGDLKL